MARRFLERVIFSCLTLGLANGCGATPTATARGPLPTNHVDGAKYPTNVTEFVQLRFFHGVPYAAASKFMVDDIPPLLGLLDNPNASADWSNAVTTLGMIGDPQATQPLIRFITGGNGKLSPEEYRAKTCAVMALGYISNRTPDDPDPRALKYLTHSAYPENWTQQELKWSSPFVDSSAAATEALAETAMLGLALSGQPAAAETLRDIQRRGTEGGASQTDRRRGALATQALREFEKIASLGLDRYYGAPSARARPF